MEIDLAACEVLRASSLASLVGEGTILEECVLLPGCRTLWVEVEGRAEWSAYEELVVDLAR